MDNGHCCHGNNVEASTLATCWSSLSYPHGTPCAVPMVPHVLSPCAVPMVPHVLSPCAVPMCCPHVLSPCAVPMVPHVLSPCAVPMCCSHGTPCAVPMCQSDMHLLCTSAGFKNILYIHFLTMNLPLL